jgi:lipoprotein-anchoring transpeptidase ErfK/SrfK
MAPAGTRIRYKRLSAAGSACAVTLVAVLGGIGILPSGTSTRPVAQQASLAGATVAEPDRNGGADAGAESGSGGPDSAGGAAPGSGPVASGQDAARFQATDLTRAQLAAAARDLPVDSGEGRRVGFDLSAQRVWLVGGNEKVRRTYPVSGSTSDNLQPGSYEVYSRSMDAWGIDDSGTMKYMVRFAHGRRAAIGFHDIPVKDDALVQSRDELGTPQSHGCIRQARPDARALWKFAPLGTTVVVTA